MHVAVQPCGDSEARTHYVDTISKLVSKSRITPYLSEAERQEFDVCCGPKVAVWGVTKGKKGQNLSRWTRLNRGDLVLLYQDKRLFSKARISYKVQNEPLAKDLWSAKEDGTTWECIYFLDDLEEIDIPIGRFNETLSYKQNFIIQGFNVYGGEEADKLVGMLGLPERDLSAAEQAELESKLPGKSLADQLKALDTLDYSATRKSRAEMGIFRKHLFGSDSTSRCDLCGQPFPVGFLVAAHIKKRASCSDVERRDLSVVMKACVFGCDALYERGLVFVDESGVVQHTAAWPSTPKEFVARINALAGLSCSAYGQDTQGYFAWHRQHRRRLSP